MYPFYTLQQLHAEAAKMDIAPAFFRYNYIINHGEPVARWELTGISPLKFDLYPSGRKKESIATVYHTTAWHTWDDGIGYENGGEEESLDAAMNEAFRACVRQGFL